MSTTDFSHLVLDCSVTMSWFFEDELTDYSEKIFNQFNNGNLNVIVPTIWLYEVANVLLIAVRKKRLTPLQAIEFRETLNLLPIKIDDAKPMNSVFELAKETGLTIYDAAYLELALRTNISIATLDKEMLKAASKLKIAAYQP